MAQGRAPNTEEQEDGRSRRWRHRYFDAPRGGGSACDREGLPRAGR
jgi:hypothetical protein